MLNCPLRSLGTSVFLFLFVSAVAGCGDGARVFGGEGTGGTGTGGESTGGTGGAAGTTGTGGRVGGTGGGTAGMTGSGGGVGSGGTTGTGGMTGTGGRGGGAGTGGSGTGGRSGTGGTGGGPGTGGAGGVNPATCNAMFAQYANEMPNAKMCLVGSIVPQCQTGVSSSLGCGSNCITYVQNATTLHQIANNWQAAGCASLIVACPAIACINPQPGICTISAGAPAGMCQNGPPTPTQ